jgi:hypothetical protein
MVIFIKNINYIIFIYIYIDIDIDIDIYLYIYIYNFEEKFHSVPWCSGYHVCLTRRRSRVQTPMEL